MAERRSFVRQAMLIGHDALVVGDGWLRIAKD
jgi:hypothetical protein